MADHAPAGAPTERPTPRWRRWLYRLISVVVVPLVLLAMIEGGLRLCGFGYPAGFFLRVPGRDAYTSNPCFGWTYFPRAVSGPPEPIYVPTEKGTEVFRVFVLGGSAAKGVPDPAYSFSRILDVMLESAFPETTFEVHNLGIQAINSHANLPIARACASLEPDLLILYMGNNEVRGPFGPGTAEGGFSGDLRTIRTSIAIKRTRLGQLASRITGAFGGGASALADRSGEEMNLSVRVRGDDSRLATMRDHFAANLADMCRAADDAGADVLLSTVAVNLKDCPPFASQHRGDLTDADRAVWDEAFAAGDAAHNAGDHARAIEHYRRAAGIDPHYAELPYRLGLCHLAAGRFDEARAAFAEARDSDGLRFRTSSRLNDVIRSVAADFAGRGIRLVDSERALADAAETPGSPGNDLFYEHVHLTFDGNYAIAKTMFNAIVDMASRPGSPLSRRPDDTVPPAPLSRDQCAERLMLTPWKQRAMLQYNVRMLSAPPFEGQIGNDQRLAEYRAQVAQIDVALQDEALPRRFHEAYTKAIEERPDDLLLRFHFTSFLLDRLHRPAEAGQHLQFLLDRLPNVQRYLMRSGRALQAQGRPDEAADVFERAVALSPDPSRTAVKVAAIYWAIGRGPRALSWAERALAGDPDLPDALAIAGQAYLIQGRFDRAAESLAAYLERSRPLPARQLADARCQLAQALARTNRSAEAAAELQRAMEVDPTYWEAHRALAMLRVISPDPAVRDAAAAVVLAERAMALTDQHEPIVLITLAAAYAENGLFDLAVEATDLALADEGRPLRPAEVATLRDHRRLYVEGIALSQRPAAP